VHPKVVSSIDGLSRPNEQPADPQEYRRALAYRDEFRRPGSVLK
jgi:hypothetical protein